MQTAADALEMATRATAAVLGIAIVLPTIASTVRRIVPAWRHLVVFDVATLPCVRRLLDRAIGLSLAAAVGTLPSTLRLTPAAAAPPVGPSASGAPYVRGSMSSAAPIGAVIPSSPVPSVVTRARTLAPAPAPPRAPTIEPERTPPAGLGTRHAVAPGEHLWAIARAELVRRALPTDDRSVGRYWALVVRINRDRLRSHDPNLVFVGEVLELPPTDGGPTAQPDARG